MNPRMHGSRALLPLLATLLLAACATTQPTVGNTVAAGGAVVEATQIEIAPSQPEQVSNELTDAPVEVDDTTAAPIPVEQISDIPTDAEQDYAAIYGAPGTSGAGADAGIATANDPWEKYNRRVHSFNSAIDQHFAKPLAQAYVAVLPQPVRTGVGNVLNNLGQPITLVNNLLQGDPRGAANTLGRFMLNSTLGIGGIFDLASKVKMPARREDFGQTLAVWGWRQSRYVELPLLGPRTVRDVLGIGGDFKLWPIGYIEHDRTRVSLEVLELLDSRAQLLSIESIGDDAVDEYALFRDVWLQRRNYQINHAGRRRAQDQDVPVAPDLPSYLLEDDDVIPDESQQPASEPDAPAPH